jgi:chromosome segregation ATPase
LVDTRNCRKQVLSFFDGNQVSETKSSLEQLISILKQERDELKLKMHLAEMDAKDEYERLSGNFDELTNQFEPLNSAVEESADNVFAALKLAAEEMKNGFHRIRKSMSEDK